MEEMCSNMIGHGDIADVKNLSMKTMSRTNLLRHILKRLSRKYERKKVYVWRDRSGIANNRPGGGARPAWQY